MYDIPDAHIYSIICKKYHTSAKEKEKTKKNIIKDK